MPALLWLLLAVDAVLALFWLALTRSLYRMRTELPALHEVSPADAPGTLSVIVPSRNEAPGVEAATRSLLAQDLPALEVIAVDDRSEDATGAILDRLAAQDPRLKVVHVSHLPEGWLGKNHANHVGAREARGEWLLFTDADVVFAPTALRRALAFAAQRALGHLVVFPHLPCPGFLERAFVGTFALLFQVRTRVWQLRRAGSPGYIGIGAFNLVRREALDATGGHATLRMEVADDLKLGMLLRRSGVRQGAIDSGGLVRVRWQQGLVASLRGLEKNAFAGCEWSWPLLLAGCLGLTVAALAPILGLWLLPAPELTAAVAALVVPMTLLGIVARDIQGGRGLEGVLFPVFALVLMLVVVHSALLALGRGGIIWRGTRYPLAALRAGCVRERDWPAAASPGWE